MPTNRQTGLVKPKITNSTPSQTDPKVTSGAQVKPIPVGQSKQSTTDTNVTVVHNTSNVNTHVNEGIPNVFTTLANTVKCHIMNNPANCLLDTGAHVSIISKVYLDKLRAKGKVVVITTPIYSHVRAVDNSTVNILGQTKLSVNIGDNTLEQTFYIIPEMQYDAILGCDFMINNKTVVDL